MRISLQTIGGMRSAVAALVTQLATLLATSSAQADDLSNENVGNLIVRAVRGTGA